MFYICQINSADVWLARYSEYLLILTHQLWNCHSPETDGEANIHNKHKSHIQIPCCPNCAQAWLVWLGPSHSVCCCSVHTENRQLADREEIFSEFDKTLDYNCRLLLNINYTVTFEGSSWWVFWFMKELYESSCEILLKVSFMSDIN